MSIQHQDTPAVIETEEENERMLKVIESLMDKGEDLSLDEENHLRSLAKLVEDFEARYYQQELIDFTIHQTSLHRHSTSPNLRQVGMT